MAGDVTSGVERLVTEALRLLPKRLRQAREQEGLSLRQLARRAGVAASTIQKIEKGALVPSVAVVLRLAEALGRRPSYFISPVDEERELELVRAGEGRPISKPGGAVAFYYVAEPLKEPIMEAYLVEVAPGGHSGEESPLAYRGEEIVLCLRGHLLFEFEGGEVVELRPGDVLHFKGHLPHRWYNPGPERAEMLMVCSFAR
ncbi:HTH-type transcriptional regulator PuuR [bacterium HR24]|nr:HTH-type transcriptional regulator PuuR [bacterium HR24]